MPATKPDPGLDPLETWCVSCGEELVDLRAGTWCASCNAQYFASLAERTRPADHIPPTPTDLLDFHDLDQME